MKIDPFEAPVPSYVGWAVRDIVGVTEDLPGSEVSESAVSHSLMRVARAKPTLAVWSGGTVCPSELDAAA